MTASARLLLMVLLLAAPLARAAAPAAATLRFVQGEVAAQAADGTRRALAVGGPVAVGERLITGPRSWADFDLADGGKLLLQPLTEFEIVELRLPPPAAASAAPPESALFRLLKGGLRTVTGLIGKRDPAHYAVRTGVATLGVRGTEYELRLCQGDCADDGEPVEDGLYLSVAAGKVALANDAGELVTAAGDHAFVRDLRTLARRLDRRPRFLERDDVAPDAARKLKRALRDRYELRMKIVRSVVRIAPRTTKRVTSSTDGTR
jgi:hypothetical protein